MRAYTLPEFLSLLFSSYPIRARVGEQPILNKDRPSIGTGTTLAPDHRVAVKAALIELRDKLQTTRHSTGMAGSGARMWF